MTIVAVYHCFPPIVGPCHWGCDDWRWCFVRPVLPKIQPMSCDDDFMPIFPSLWELLLRTVFQDWIVDDGNYYPSCGNPYGNYDPLTISVKVRLKSLLAVCSVVNSAGQRVLLFVEKQLYEIYLLRSIFKKWCHEPWTSPPFDFIYRTSNIFLIFIIVLETP